MNRSRRTIKFVIRVALPVLVLVLLLAALPLYGRATASDRISPALHRELDSGQQYLSVAVEFSFHPQYYNLQKLQSIGTLAGVNGNVVKVLEVDAGQVQQIADLYWVKRVETIGEALNTLEYTFDHVHVYCTDIVASERFFVDVLDARVVERRGTAQAPTVAVDLGGASILLRPRLAGETLAAAGPPRFGADHLGVRVTSVIDTVDELRRRGAVISSEPRELRPGVFVAFVQGPDQVRVELLSRAEPTRGETS